MIIGLTGVAQVGKDTAAAALIERGWVRVAFADPLREMLYALNPKVTDEGCFVDYVKTMVDEVGWEKAKKHPEVRRLLQRLGTEAGRGVLGEDCWVDLAHRKINKLRGDAAARGDNQPSVVLTDVRFANEASMIRSLGGYVVRIIRPGISAINGHVSESGVPDKLVDHTLENGGSIADLQEGIVRFVSSL